jgi:hypothetical protein
MKTMNFLASVVFGLFLSGCAVVQSDKAIGEKAVTVNADDWDGVWTFSGGAVNAAVVDKDKGLLEIAWVERKDGKFEMETYRVGIMQQGDAIIANLEDVKDKGRYLFSLIKKNPDEVVLWIPEMAKFKKLVQNNVLSGKILEENKMLLENLSPSQMEMIATEKNGKLFIWDSPIVLKRAMKIKYDK